MTKLNHKQFKVSQIFGQVIEKLGPMSFFYEKIWQNTSVDKLVCIDGIIPIIMAVAPLGLYRVVGLPLTPLYQNN